MEKIIKIGLALLFCFTQKFNLLNKKKFKQIRLTTNSTLFFNSNMKGMKSIILNLFILFYLSQTNAQARIGSTESEIRAEFSEKSFKSGYDKDGDKWISMETDISTVRYYFNAKNDWKCFITQVIPDNQGALNSMVERYNKQYVIISETEWRIYGKNGIMRIKLIFEDGGGYYFIMGSN